MHSNNLVSALALIVSGKYIYIAHAQNSFKYFWLAPHATFGLLVVATFLGSSKVSTTDWIKGETVVIEKGDDPFLCSMLSVDI